MEIFNAIGLAVPQGKTLDDLVKAVEKRGEATISTRSIGTIHGRCWRIGSGLEVWTTLYESETGEIFNADCRPGFRARYKQNISDWTLYEDEREGEAVVQGKIEDYSDKVFFQLQNLTEVSLKNFERKTLIVGLCGLAYRAEIAKQNEPFKWKSLSTTAENSKAKKSDWRLCGRIIKFNALRNPFSGSYLYWIHLDLGNFELEVLTNQDILAGSDLRVGAMIKADVWLQGHVAGKTAFISGYEGVDWSFGTTDFWRKFKKIN